jgi:hypothetical protein
MKRKRGKQAINALLRHAAADACRDAAERLSNN